MSGTIDGEHARRMAAFRRDTESLPALRDDMEREADGPAKTTMRKRIREIESQEADYLLKVAPLFQKAGQDPASASTRGDLYAEYVRLVGDSKAQARLSKFETDREMDVLMANSRKRRKGMKRKGPSGDPTDFECTDPECGGTRVLREEEASMVCTKCGLSEEWQEGNVAFGTGVYTTSSQYLRKNHLNEVLLQVQGPVEIYLLTSPDGKHYVGQTQCMVRNGSGGWRKNGFHARWLQHKRRAAKPEQAGQCTVLARSIRKHGPDAFQTRVLVRVSKSLANAYEKKFIEAYNCLAPNGLNLTSGGDVYEFSVESRQRMSQAKRARGSYSDKYKAILSASARKRQKQSGLPNFIVQLAARGTNSPGYRVQIYHNGKVYRTEYTAKGEAMEEKLARAVQARDMIMKDLGMAPLEVPAEVVEEVKKQLTIHKVTDMKKVTRALVRKYLRDLKHIKVTRKDGSTYITEGPKYYKHTSQIAQRISGRQEVCIPPWITRKIRRMFSVIEVAFDEIRPEYRKNFSNYAPVINHLLELLDDPEADALMKHFPKLKSKDKHLDQEILWEKACKRVQWQYIRH